MRDANLPIQYRDTCAHLLIPLNRCRSATYYLPWKCEVRRPNRPAGFRPCPEEPRRIRFHRGLLTRRYTGREAQLREVPVRRVQAAGGQDGRAAGGQGRCKEQLILLEGMEGASGWKTSGLGAGHCIYGRSDEAIAVEYILPCFMPASVSLILPTRPRYHSLLGTRRLSGDAGLTTDKHGVARLETQRWVWAVTGQEPSVWSISAWIWISKGGLVAVRSRAELMAQTAGVASILAVQVLRGLSGLDGGIPPETGPTISVSFGQLDQSLAGQARRRAGCRAGEGGFVRPDSEALAYCRRGPSFITAVFMHQKLCFDFRCPPY